MIYVQWQYNTSILIIFVVKMHAGCYRYITLRSSSSVCPSPDTILPSFFFFFMFWNKRLYWALWHIFWSYYQGKQENSGRLIYQTSSFVIRWLLFNTHGSSYWYANLTPSDHAYLSHHPKCKCQNLGCLSFKTLFFLHMFFLFQFAFSYE